MANACGVTTAICANQCLLLINLLPYLIVFCLSLSVQWVIAVFGTLQRTAVASTSKISSMIRPCEYWPFQLKKENIRQHLHAHNSSPLSNLKSTTLKKCAQALGVCPLVCARRLLCVQLRNYKYLFDTTRRGSVSPYGENSQHAWQQQKSCSTLLFKDDSR